MGCSSQSLQAMLMGNSREKGEVKEEGNLFFFFPHFFARAKSGGRMDTMAVTVLGTLK